MVHASKLTIAFADTQLQRDRESNQVCCGKDSALVHEVLTLPGDLQLQL